MRNLKNLETGNVVEVPDHSKWVGHPNFVEVTDPRGIDPKGGGSESRESRTPTEPRSSRARKRTSKRKG